MMKNKIWLMVLGFLCAVLTINGCGTSTDTGGATTGIQPVDYYAEASDTTPVFTPAARIAAASTWESGNTLYEIFYALREYVHPDDDSVIDRANIYRLLYDVTSLFSSMTNEVIALSTAETIVPPFNFGNNYTYDHAVNDTSGQRAAAMITSGNTTKGVVTWIWGGALDPDHQEYGVFEATMDNATKDLSVDFIFCVDYSGGDTVTNYNNRTRISGNADTHAFEFVQTIGGSIESNKLVQIVGKGVSQGSGNHFLLKVKSNNGDGFDSPLYLVVSAEADENTLMNFDVSAEAFTDPASLPAAVANYKDFVENTAFYAFSDLLTDLADLNSGNPKAGTIYLNY